MPLIEWDSADKLRNLLELLQKDGIGIPNNLVAHNSILFSIKNSIPVYRMRFFSTAFVEGTSLLYVFIVQESSYECCSIFARPPTREHNITLLWEALTELLKDRIDQDREITLKSDTFTRDMLLDRASSLFEIIPRFKSYVFYMNDDQIQMAKGLEMPTIDGFHEDSADVERDAARIHNNWKLGVSLEATKAYIRYLPSSVIRDSSTGDAVAWAITIPFGLMSSHFALPEHRGKGLAYIVGGYLAKKFDKLGLRPFNYVNSQNSDVLDTKSRNPYFTPWEEQKSQNNRNTGMGDTDYFPIHTTSIKKVKRSHL